MLDDEARAPARIWKAGRSSRSLTKLLHRFPEDGPFERRMRIAELDYLPNSIAMQTAIVESRVGLPLSGNARAGSGDALEAVAQS